MATDVLVGLVIAALVSVVILLYAASRPVMARLGRLPGPHHHYVDAERNPDAEQLEGLGVDEVLVRSVITCENTHGVCAKCYGRDLARGHIVNKGEAIGVIAAQSIGEPGTQLTMRTFHIGGAASSSASVNSIEVRNAGTIRLHSMKTITNSSGKMISVSRSCEVGVIDANGREKERYKLPYGAEFNVADGDSVEAGATIATWDPHMHPVITEVAGKIKFTDFVEAVTVQHKVDEMTGLTSIEVSGLCTACQTNEWFSHRAEKGRTAMATI